MKNFFTLWCLILVFAASSSAQYGYFPEKLSGDLYYRDLTNPGNAVLKGTGPTNLAGSDFDLNGNLYAISEASNEFSQIDTSNATSTLSATVTPPGAEFWSGMACDPTDGTMYLCSTDGNGNTFYTIDDSNGNITLIGTNAVDDGVVGIAFTNDGQMYAIYLVGKFYMIDKTDASATFVGNMTNAARGLTNHGLDFDELTQTMYMVSYNVFTFDNELWTIDISTGSNSLVGSVGVWAATMAVEPSFTAAFMADSDSVCEGDVVNFTDMSTGGATSWNWTFEGGSPATSTQQNPAVTYNSSGDWDVTLEVSNGSVVTSLTVADYINVEAVPVQAATPAGPDETCGGEQYIYSTSAIANATSYLWIVEPTDAGSITGSGTNGTFTAATDWTGSYTVKVRASNSCGDGSWSPTLAATLYASPTAFFFSGGGSYCEGGDGLELTLDGSETGFDYELYYDGTATGNIMAGTGSPLSFGFVTDEGFYTVEAFSVTCSQQMNGQPYVSVLEIPGTPATPVGPDMVCNNAVNEYTTTESTDADTMYWSITPADAGTLTIAPDMLTAEVEWSNIFTGTADLSVFGSNDCGTGDSSTINITVNASPAPEVTGLEMVCEDDVANYSTQDNTGSSYEWEVSGGTIIDGTGTHNITVQWGGPGTGYVEVSEDDGTCVGTSEQFMVTIDDCVGVEESALEDASIYPNPAKQLINIAIPGVDKVNIRIVNMLGKVMIDLGERNMEDSEMIVNLESLDAGIYFLHLTTNGQAGTYKFVKAK